MGTRFRETLIPIDGKKLHHAIIEHGYSITYLCNQTGLKQQTISASLNRNMIGYTRLKTICSAIDAYPEQFFAADTEPKSNADSTSAASAVSIEDIPVNCIRMLQDASNLLSQRNISFNINVDFGNGLVFRRENTAAKRKTSAKSKKTEPKKQEDISNDQNPEERV